MVDGCCQTADVSDVARTYRSVLDGLLGWISFGYGLYATAVEPTLTHDDTQIAVGAEAVLLAVLSFLWARQRRSLGVALVISGLAAPVAMYATAPLYWDPRDVTLFDSEAFWTTVGVGSAVGIPLLALGIFILVRARSAPERPDPFWLTPLRWILQLGLILIVVAFRGGDWDNGIPLVYAGGAIALLALVIALPRRIAIRRGGVGLLLLFLGLGGIIVIVVAGAAVGGNMSGDEAAVGLIPAAAVAGLGLLLVLSAGRATAPAVAVPLGPEGPAIDGLADSMMTMTPPPPRD